jgi:hypothetical protein
VATPHSIADLIASGWVQGADGEWYRQKRNEVAQVDSKTPGAEPQHNSRQASDGDSANQTRGARKCLVRFTCYRIRRQDPDNGVYKWHIDALRYAGLIPNDTEDDIEIAASQKRVRTRKQERVEIELTKP